MAVVQLLQGATVSGPDSTDAVDVAFLIAHRAQPASGSTSVLTLITGGEGRTDAWILREES